MQKDPLNVGAGSGIVARAKAGSVGMAVRKSPEALSAQAQINAMNMQELHQAKLAKTNQNFANARVTSTKGVLMKNGVAVCVPFDHPNKKPVDTKRNRLPEVTSFSSDVFKPRPALHAGM